MTDTTGTATKCQAFDHKGTKACTKDATHTVTVNATGATMDRCSGHARKYAALPGSFTITREATR